MNRRKRDRRIAAMAALAMFLIAPLIVPRAACAQAFGIPKPILDDGRRVYVSHCATCHGESAKGDGPMASILTIKPPDLTQIAKKSGGKFHYWKVFRSVYGLDLPKAHGGKMPVWGSEFQFQWEHGQPGGGERVLEVVFYLESIQQK
jgi:mono/diheme cytochrome c family protein